MLTYKGLRVPSGVERNREVLCTAVSDGARGCIFNATPRSAIGNVGCSGIACPNCICDQTHRDTLKEYLNKAEKESSVEEQIKKILKPGMVLRTKKGEFFLWIGGAREEVYRLERLHRCIALAECDFFVGEYDDVDAVYAYHRSEAPAVCVFSLVNLMQGKNCQYMRCVWKKPAPVKDMTVAEISKALGYEVRVVANEKADD